MPAKPRVQEAVCCARTRRHVVDCSQVGQVLVGTYGRVHVCWCGCGSQARVCLRWSCRVACWMGATHSPTRVGLLYNRCTACLGLCMCTAHGVVEVVVVVSGGHVQQFASKHVSVAADSGGSVVFARAVGRAAMWQGSSWGTTRGLCGTTPHVQCRACWCWRPVDVSHAASGQAGVEHAPHLGVHVLSGWCLFGVLHHHVCCF